MPMASRRDPARRSNSFQPQVEALEARDVPATLYVLDATASGGRLSAVQGTTADTDVAAAAGAGRYTEAPPPAGALVYAATGLTGPYQAGGATGFDLLVDTGPFVSGKRSAVMARVSYDFTGDGTFDRVETFNNFATNPSAGFETYTAAKGFRSQTGAFADFAGGSVRLELWSAFGTDLVLLGTSSPGPAASKLVVPFALTGTPPPPTPTPPPTLTVGDATTPEGNANSQLAFTLRLSAASAVPVTVAYETRAGTATAGSDFIAQTGTVTFAAGQTQASVLIDIVGDTAVEPTETFSVVVTSVTDATVLDGTGVGTITNDDVAQPSPPVGSVPATVSTEHDTFPVFGHAYSVHAVRSGSWSDPGVWSRTPTAGDSVYIPAGTMVTLNGPADVTNLLVAGTFELGSGASLRTVNLFGLEGSSISTAGSVSNVQIIIKDVPINTATDPLQFGTGLIALGELHLEGVAKTGFARTTAAAGASVLVLDRVPANWQVGDRLAVADTRQLVATKTLRQNGPNYDQTEDVFVVGVAGNVVTLNRALYYRHDNAPVANLTRSVVIRSENPNGTRGHVMAAGDAEVTIKNVALTDLGRTDAGRVLNSGKRNADGSYTIGTNQVGRYSLHLHHLHHPFVASGNAIAEGKKWGVAIHDSHYGTLTDNVIVRVDGAGVMTEEGNETGNLIAGNLAMNVRSGYQTTHGGVLRFADGSVDTGTDGSGFWFRGPSNVVRDNVAVASFIGFNYNGYYLPETYQIPVGPGADHGSGYHLHFQTVNRLPMGASANNEALAVGIGLWITFPEGSTIEAHTGTTFENYRISNVYGDGVHLYHTAYVTLKGFTITSDPAVSSRNQGDTNDRIAMLGETNTGIFAAHDAYENGGLTVLDATITGFNVGIQLPLNTLLGSKATATATAPVVVRGGRLSNYVNLIAGSPMSERDVTISGVTFEPSPVARVGSLPASSTNLWMRFFMDNQTQPKVLSRQSLTLNGRKVYFLEQRPSFVVPGQGGKINAQLWALSGQAVAGEISPTTNQEAGIIGYISPV